MTAVSTYMYRDVSKSFRTGRLKRELQVVRLSATKCSCIAILWVNLVSFAAITLWVASQREFVVVVSLSTQSGNFWIHLMYAISHKFIKRGSTTFSHQNPSVGKVSLFINSAFNNWHFAFFCVTNWAVLFRLHTYWNICVIIFRCRPRRGGGKDWKWHHYWARTNREVYIYCRRSFDKSFPKRLYAIRIVVGLCTRTEELTFSFYCF
jgi:hypothetical protein